MRQSVQLLTTYCQPQLDQTCNNKSISILLVLTWLLKTRFHGLVLASFKFHAVLNTNLALSIAEAWSIVAKLGLGQPFILLPGIVAE